MNSFTNIPVSLCEYALVNRKVNQVKVYIYLKINSNSYVENNEALIKELSGGLQLHPKTILKCLEWLISKKWITVNSKIDKLHIISYKRLAQKLDIDLGVGYFYEPDSYIDFNAVCAAVVITYYLSRKRFFNRKQSGAKRALSMKNCRNKSGFYSMANGYLAKCLGVSIATACRYKQLAEKYGYIEVKSNLIVLEDIKGNPLSSSDFDFVRRMHLINEQSDILRKGKKYIKQVGPALIKSNIKCKKKTYVKKGKK